MVEMWQERNIYTVEVWEGYKMDLSGAKAINKL